MWSLLSSILVKASCVIFFGVAVVGANEANEVRELTSSSSNWQLFTSAGAYGVPNYLGGSASGYDSLSTSGAFALPIGIALVPNVDVLVPDVMAIVDVNFDYNTNECGYSEFYSLNYATGLLNSVFNHHASQIAFLPNGNALYISPEGSNIMTIDNNNGESSWFAGKWNDVGYSGDGFAATSSQLQNPQGITVDSMGNVFIADSGNKVIRKVDSDGIITTYAGQFYNDAANADGPTAWNGPIVRYSGDGGAAELAHFTFPTGVAADLIGNIYIADNGANAIRKVNPDGIISRIAGVPNSSGYNGDGLATSTLVEAPYAIAVDGNGVNSGYMIRRIDAQTGMLTTIAGMPTNGKDQGWIEDPSWTQLYMEYYPDDPAVGVPGTSIALNSVTSLAFDSNGNLWFTEPVANVVRVLVPTAPTSMPTISPSKSHKPTMKQTQKPTVKQTQKPTVKQTQKPTVKKATTKV